MSQAPELVCLALFGNRLCARSRPLLLPSLLCDDRDDRPCLPTRAEMSGGQLSAGRALTAARRLPVRHKEPFRELSLPLTVASADGPAELLPPFHQARMLPSASLPQA